MLRLAAKAILAVGREAVVRIALFLVTAFAMSALVAAVLCPVVVFRLFMVLVGEYHESG